MRERYGAAARLMLTEHLNFFIILVWFEYMISVLAKDPFPAKKEQNAFIHK